MDQAGNIRVIKAADVKKDPVAVHVAVIQQGGLTPAQADAVLVKAGLGDEVNASTITQLAKGVDREVKKQLKFTAKTAVVITVGVVAGAGVTVVAGTGVVAVAAAGAVGESPARPPAMSLKARLLVPEHMWLSLPSAPL
jgi:hypothetical protein